jgi:hypothetical protein
MKSAFDLFSMLGIGEDTFVLKPHYHFNSHVYCLGDFIANTNTAQWCLELQSNLVKSPNSPMC